MSQKSFVPQAASFVSWALKRDTRTQADADHVRVKTEMLQLRLMERKRELVRMDEVTAMIDDMMGVVLTAMSSMPARCAPRGDLVMRRKLEAIVFEVSHDTSYN